MIYIEKDQQLLEQKNLRVILPSGNYDDDYLIEVYDESDPGAVIGSFAAQFIKYGSMVYRFGNVQDLGEEILKVDPESTHLAAAYVRMQKELLKKFTEGNLENKSLDFIIESEDLKSEDNPVTGESISASSQSLSASNTDTITSSVNNNIPAVNEDVVATTTESVSVEGNTFSTTTEPSIPVDIANSTSTDQI